eukprot:6728601-Lingulodinium_polyedra.AAC.1
MEGIIVELGKRQAVGLQGARLRKHPRAGLYDLLNQKGWKVLHWGYSNGKHTYKAVGVAIALGLLM